MPRALAPSATDSRRPCTCFLLRRTARLVSRFYDQHLAALGLKTTQFSLLSTLELGPAPITELAHRLGLERTSLTRNLKPLVADGSIELRQGEDARERIPELTPLGRRRLHQARAAWLTAQQEVDAALGSDFVDGLHRSLSSVRRTLSPLLLESSHE